MCDYAALNAALHNNRKKKKKKNMLVDVASTRTMWPGSAFQASITRLQKKCFLRSNLALGFSSFSVCPLDLLSLMGNSTVTELQFTAFCDIHVCIGNSSLHPEMKLEYDLKVQGFLHNK